MIAYVRMQLLRWLRRTLGIGLLVAAVFLPTLMAALWLVFGGMGATENPLRSFITVVVLCVLAGSGISIGTQVSSLVEEEARLKRSVLLRVGDLDGFRAVGAYSLLGLVLAFLHGTAGYVGPAVVALYGGIPPGTWLAPAGASVVLLSAFGPPAILGSFLLPRVLGLIVLNSAALVAGIVLATGPLVTSGTISPGLVAGVLVVHVVFLGGGGLLWRAKSASVW